MSNIPLQDDSEDDMNLLKLRFEALQSAVKIKKYDSKNKRKRLPSPPRHRHYFQKSSSESSDSSRKRKQR